VTLLELVEAWDNNCIICGEPFVNLDCVTREHIIPKSLGGKIKNNLAPSHYSCNKARGNKSLLKCKALINLRRRSMTPEQFVKWLNKPEPSIEALYNKYGREKVDAIRMTWNIETAWPWWLFK